MLEWILEEAIPKRYTYEAITQRILVVNFAGILSSSLVRCLEHSLGSFMISETDSRIPEGNIKDPMKVDNKHYDVARYENYISKKKKGRGEV